MGKKGGNAKKKETAAAPAAAAPAAAAPAEDKAAARAKHESAYALLKYPTIVLGVGASVYVGMLKEWTWFSWHPILMLIACIPVAVHATLLKRIGGLENTRMHGNLMSLACLLMMGGFYVIYTNKEALGKEHFVSWHAFIGSTVFIGFLIVGVAGSLAIHPDYGLFKSNQLYRSVHKLLGRLCLLWAWSACMSGFIIIQPDPKYQAVLGVPLLYLANNLLS